MIGDTLRQAREKKRLSIKDVERGTSIRALYIEAIEKGDFQTLPGAVYAKGFVRNYANFLKLDAESCLRQYVEENNLEAPKPVEEVQSSQEEGQRRVDATHLVSGEDFRQRVENSNSGSKLILGVIVAAVVIGGSYFAFGFDEINSKPSKPSTQVASQTKPAAKPAEKPDAKPPAAKPAEQPAAKPAEQPAAKPATPAAKPADNKTQASGVEVSAIFTDRCWTKVVADGQTIYEGTAEKGKTMSWKGNETIAITAGNAGALELSHNGKNLGKAGDYGQVIDKVFTKDQAN